MPGLNYINVENWTEACAQNLSYENTLLQAELIWQLYTLSQQLPVRERARHWMRHNRWLISDQISLEHPQTDTLPIGWICFTKKVLVSEFYISLLIRWDFPILIFNVEVNVEGHSDDSVQHEMQIVFRNLSRHFARSTLFCVLHILIILVILITIFHLSPFLLQTD